MNRKTYPTDLNDAEWEILKPLLPEAKGGGRPRPVDLREILNGIFYREGSGWAWERRPHDLATSKTVYDDFNQGSANGTGEKINGELVRQVRQAAGRDPQPSAAIIDSPSVKTSEKGANAAMMQPRK